MTTFEILARQDIDPSAPVKWTIPASQAKERLMLVLPFMAVLIVSAFFTRDVFEMVGSLVVYGLLILWMILYVARARDRHYELTPDGFRTTHGSKVKAYRWSEFDGWQTHTEASTRRVRGLVAKVGDTLGETFLLHPRSFWSFGVGLVTLPHVEPLVRARMTAASLEHRPGMHVNGAVILLVVALVLVVMVGAIAMAILTQEAR